VLAFASDPPVPSDCPANSTFRYQRREPERTLLHRIVRENLATFLCEAAERYPSGDLPTFIAAEFERYLQCGILSHGFARVRCPTCRDELLVAFACKNRGVCPSCCSRRMADTAAHLRDYVLPSVPVRQWVFTLPKRLRFLLAWRPKLISLALRLFLRALFAWQRRCARRQGVKDPLCGAVTMIQRFGSALNLNLHFHTLVPDGVFFEDGDGDIRFHALAPPTRSDLEKLIRKIVPRLLRKLGAEELPEQAEWMDALAEALQSGASKAVDDPPRGLCVLAEGFSLHAGVFADELDGEALERLARYCARPPLALRRLSLAEDGQILYRVKHAAPGAPRLLRLSPTQFLGKLSALVPPPRSHLTRFHGIFAPHSKHRSRIVPTQPQAAAPAPPEEVPSTTASADPGKKPPPSPIPLSSPPRGPYRLPWATLLRRVFAVDVLTCDRCGGKRRLVALVDKQEAITKILAHLGLPQEAPSPWLARAPPQELDPVGPMTQDGIDPIPTSWYD
jgi:hypothetical protein